MRTTISLRKMQAKKMKEILKSMLMFSKSPSAMEATIRMNIMSINNLMSTKEEFLQEDLSHLGIKKYYLDIVSPAIILVIK